QCLIGYACQAGECEPSAVCEADEDCAVGVCDGEICVNPEVCASNADCLARTYCGAEGECIAEPCAEAQCERGVCERGTGFCVSAPSCTVATQDVDSLAGERCAGGVCASAEDFCSVLSCERGVCDFEANGCTNAGSCTEDLDCV